MNLKLVTYLDSHQLVPGGVLSGFLCVQVRQKSDLPVAVVRTQEVALRSLTCRIECIEHYWFEEHYTTVTSSGRGGLRVQHHTRTVHRYHTNFTRDSFPFFVKDAISFGWASEAYVPVGAHHLRFAISLPNDAPCTFRCGRSEIFYKLSVLRSADLTDPRTGRLLTETLFKKFERCLVVRPPSAALVEAYSRAAHVPAPASSNSSDFWFGRGDVRMFCKSLQSTLEVGASATVAVEIRVENNSSKTVDRLTVSLVRMSGNAHTGMNVSNLQSSRDGHTIGDEVELARDIKPGVTFALPLSTVTIPHTSAIPQSEVATILATTVYQLFFVRVRAHVSWAADILVNLPLTVAPPPQVVAPAGEPAPPSYAELLDIPHVNTDTSKKAESVHAEHVVAEPPSADVKITAHVVHGATTGAASTAPTEDLDADDFVEVTPDSLDKRVTDHDLRSSQAPKIADTSSTGVVKDSNDNDDDDDDDDNDNQRFFAVLNLEGRTLALEAPQAPPLLSCPECRGFRWGALRVHVRAICNLPSKNFLNHASDPYVKVELIDWLRGTRSGYNIKTQTLDDVLSGQFNSDGLLVGGVAFNQYLRVSAHNSNSFVDRKFGQLIFDWATLAALTPMSMQESQAPLPPIPSSEAVHGTTAAVLPTIRELETHGVWFKLKGDRKSEKRGAAVCVVVQRVVTFGVDNQDNIAEVFDDSVQHEDELTHHPD